MQPLLWGVAWYVVTIALLAESQCIYCAAFIHIHSRPTNVSAPLRLNTQRVRANSSYTYLQRVCIRVSAFFVLSVVCLLYFEPFRDSVIFLSVFLIHVYTEYARVSAFFIYIFTKRILYYGVYCIISCLLVIL